MVPVRQYSTFINSIISEIPEIMRAIRVESEAQMTKHCGNLSENELVLFFLTPSITDRLDNIDNKSDENTCLAYILQKVDITNMDEADELNVLEVTQNAAIAFREKIYARKDHPASPYFVRHIRFNNLDPEFNLNGCNGYSWSFFIDD
jgi:hypothetical protein